ncbi:hypothetical protein LXL04_004564 [Taraxacum kok-saghyz]
MAGHATVVASFHLGRRFQAHWVCDLSDRSTQEIVGLGFAGLVDVAPGTHDGDADPSGVPLLPLSASDLLLWVVDGISDHGSGCLFNPKIITKCISEIGMLHMQTCLQSHYRSILSKNMSKLLDSGNSLSYQNDMYYAPSCVQIVIAS